MVASSSPSRNLWSRLYAGTLTACGLALLAVAPLSHRLFAGDQLEQQAVAAVAARHLLQPAVGAVWALGAFLMIGGLFWLVRSLRWAAALGLLLTAALSIAALAGADRLFAVTPAIRPTMAIALSVSEPLLPQLRARLYAYAEREGLGFIDRSALMARRQQRGDALWVELTHGEDTVAVASDMLHPGKAAIQFYDPPGQQDSGVWKERLTSDLATTWPDVAVTTLP